MMERVDSGSQDDHTLKETWIGIVRASKEGTESLITSAGDLTLSRTKAIDMYPKTLVSHGARINSRCP